MTIYSAKFFKWLYEYYQTSRIIVALAVIDKSNYNISTTIVEMCILIETGRVQIQIHHDENMFYLSIKDREGDTFDTQLWDIP